MKRYSVLVAIVALMAFHAHAGLLEYVGQPDDSYAVEPVATDSAAGNTIHTLRLTSQTWRGIVWKHWLTVFVPANLKHRDTAMLLITGGDNTDGAPNRGSDEAQILGQIAAQTGTVVAILEQVPNQPLFDGKYEDGTIAYTFEQYLDGKGEDWPLLFPMVKSAVRAMDAVQQLAQSENIPVKRFVVTGASKRGWTTWLTGAVDSRVAGIAPMVIDTLNMPKQTEHQLKVYGSYSEEVRDYTERHIQERTNTPEGQRLLKEVDPFIMRQKYSMPKLILLGTNDPYWNVDSANWYFSELPEKKYLHYAANAGHGLNVGIVPAVIAFYQSVLNMTDLPQMAWEHVEPDALKVTWEGPATRVLLWQATSPNRDFRDSAWTSTLLEGDGEVVATFQQPADGWSAAYVEVVFPNPNGGMPYGLSTTMTVLPDKYPVHENLTK